MNWALVVPELVLSIAGMGILLFGVLRRQDSALPASMLTLGAFLLTAVLVASSTAGFGYRGQFVVDPFSGFVKILILASAAMALILSLD
ncbi:MAG: NADH-quinone oxidoreductase subunit N, partial [Alphaproteobacteria bacterium]|nr:NADH-quinone oxidoreductase subunit N [Alphaproteobacteria bacterium]